MFTTSNVQNSVVILTDIKQWPEGVFLHSCHIHEHLFSRTYLGQRLIQNLLAGSNQYLLFEPLGEQGELVALDQMFLTVLTRSQIFQKLLNVYKKFVRDHFALFKKHLTPHSPPKPFIFIQFDKFYQINHRNYPTLLSGRQANRLKHFDEKLRFCVYHCDCFIDAGKSWVYNSNGLFTLKCLIKDRMKGNYHYLLVFFNKLMNFKRYFMEEKSRHQQAFMGD